MKDNALSKVQGAVNAVAKSQGGTQRGTKDIRRDGPDAREVSQYDWLQYDCLEEDGGMGCTPGEWQTRTD